MRILNRALAALALATLALATTASAAADKPLVMESGKVKQLPSSTTIQLNASGTGAAPINIPHGTAPTSPNNGDCWTTTGGLYCQVNGSTVGPYSTGGTITSKDEGSSLTSATTSIDYVGAGVTATNVGGAVTVTIPAGGGGTVTTTGSPASGNLTKFSGATSVTNGDLAGDVTTSGTLTSTIANDAVTYAKMQNVSAASKLLGRGDSGSGDPQEITLGTGLTMTGTTLSASGGGGSSLTVKEEGSTLTSAATSIDFVGGTVTATNVSDAVTVTVAADLGVLHAYDERPNGNAGGTTSASTWHQRVLNTISLNSISGASIRSSTVTISIASPGVVTWNSHGLSNGSAIVLTTTGALPTGLSTSTTYFVVSATANTFQLSTTVGGAALNTSGSQSGTHTANSGHIVLPAGTYDFSASAPVYDATTLSSAIRLYNVTDSSVIMLGSTSWDNAGNREQRNIVQGRFTLAATKDVAVYSFSGSAEATSGLGVNAGLTGVNNHFADIYIRRVN